MTQLRDQLQATLTGSYTIERELGGGGMSKVFVAEETRLRRKVVVKVLSPELAQGLSVERFEREIQTVAALQHANIVPVHTAGDPAGDSVGLARFDIVFRGRMPEGVRRLDAVADKQPSLAVADLYARAGEVGKAKAVLARYESTTPGGVQRVASQSWHEARGNIALAERRFADAIREFRASDTDTSGVPADCIECAQISLARAFDAANQADSTIATMERYLAIPPRRQNYVNDAHFLRAMVHERLGQLYEAKGDTAKAVSNYRTFIALWKDAEPEFQPRVAEAGRRLEKLTPVEKLR